jgi:hypothetical protein
MTSILMMGLLAFATTTPANNNTANNNTATPSFKITTKRDNDRVEVKSDQDQAILSIRSPFGISNAVIERMGEKWPEGMIIRLYVNGLENIQISNGKVKLEASVSSQDGRVRLWKDHKEDVLLDAQSPLWMAIRMVGSDGKLAQTIPLQNGCFEMRLPRAFFDGNPKAITVNWVDFYRH